MNVIKSFIETNKYSRPGYGRHGTRAIAVHWNEYLNATGVQVRDYFDSLKFGKQDWKNNITYGSTQFCIGIRGDIVQTMGINEEAYHVGSDRPYKEGAKECYTPLAQSLFPEYCNSSTSPNKVVIGIELGHIDWKGTMTSDTLDSAVELCAWLCRYYGLMPESRLLRHYDIVGWKKCPLLFVEDEAEWTKFKGEVGKKLYDRM